MVASELVSTTNTDPSHVTSVKVLAEHENLKGYVNIVRSSCQLNFTRFLYCQLLSYISRFTWLTLVLNSVNSI